jgi:hypothetical protein
MNTALQIAREERKEIWNKMVDLTNRYGFFSRKQLAQAVSEDETTVGYWLKHFIDGEDVVVETAGTFHVNPEQIGRVL